MSAYAELLVAAEGERREPPPAPKEPEAPKAPEAKAEDKPEPDKVTPIKGKNKQKAEAQPQA